MTELSAFVRAEIWSILVSLLLVVGYQLLTGRINTKGLLGDESRAVSAGRVQMLFLTLGTAGYLLVQIRADPTQFPTLPNELVLGLTGSHGVYLGLKLREQLLNKLGRP